MSLFQCGAAKLKHESVKHTNANTSNTNPRFCIVLFCYVLRRSNWVKFIVDFCIKLWITGDTNAAVFLEDDLDGVIVVLAMFQGYVMVD